MFGRRIVGKEGRRGCVKSTGASVWQVLAVGLLRGSINVAGLGDDCVGGVLAVTIEEGIRQVDKSSSDPEEDYHKYDDDDLKHADELWLALADAVKPLSCTTNDSQADSQHDAKNEVAGVGIPEEDGGIDKAVDGDCEDTDANEQHDERAQSCE